MTGVENTLEEKKRNAETTVPLSRRHPSAQGTEVAAGERCMIMGKHQHFI